MGEEKGDRFKIKNIVYREEDGRLGTEAVLDSKKVNLKDLGGKLVGDASREKGKGPSPVVVTETPSKKGRLLSRKA